MDTVNPINHAGTIGTPQQISTVVESAIPTKC